MLAVIVPIAIAILAATAATAPLASQELSEGHFVLGVGAGFGEVSKPAESGVGPQLNGRIGVIVSGQVTGVLEVGVFGPENETPEVGDIVVNERGTSTVVRRPTLLRTPVLLLGIQVQSVMGVYVRGSVGLGRHTFAAYGPWPSMNTVSTSSELGPAAGLTAGYTWPLDRRLRVGAEAVAILSGGEDSTADRTILGLQIVSVVHVR